MSVIVNRSLSGKVALVTGGSRGIGRSTARALAEAGAAVAVAARTRAAVEETAAELAALGGPTLGVVADVTDAGDVERLAGAVRGGLGHVDVLVNGAGGGGSHRFVGHPDDLWHRMIALNATSAYYVTKAFLPAMVERRWGRVVNIASTAAQTGGRYIAAYAAAKHAVLGMTRALALEVAAAGVTVNAVCPGFVDTPMTGDTIANIVARTGRSEAEARRVLEDASPQRRLMTAEEVAAAVVFLALETSRGITGQAITIDGGGSTC